MPVKTTGDMVLTEGSSTPGNQYEYAKLTSIRHRKFKWSLPRSHLDISRTQGLAYVPKCEHAETGAGQLPSGAGPQRRNRTWRPSH